MRTLPSGPAWHLIGRPREGVGGLNERDSRDFGRHVVFGGELWREFRGSGVVVGVSDE